MSNLIIFSTFLAIYFLMIWKAGNTFPILYLFFFTYFLQYLFATYLIYNEYGALTSQMPIGSTRYFEYAVPAFIFLFAGVFIFNKDVNVAELLRRVDPGQASRLGYLLLAVSFVFDALPILGISTFQSILSFTTYLKYPAAFCFLFSNSRFSYFLIALIYCQLAVIVLRGGVFINFFIWSTFLFFFVSLKFNFSMWLRMSFILIAVPVLIIVQTVKDEYRKATWEGHQEGGVGLFTELAEKKNLESSEKQFSQSEGVIKTVGRLSQGWHLALVLKRVPKREPFADGEEMLSDIYASILPRIFFADKKTIGSQEKFFQYTGHRLYGSTSMTIGVIGDFYINFGRWGSFLLLFVFGAFISKALKVFIVRFVLPDPLNIVWVPFMLNYLIRANNDFYVVFNCLLKGLLIFLLISFLRRTIWPAKVRRTFKTLSTIKPIY